MTCTDCKKTPAKQSARLPRGWKHKGDDYYCPDCWIKHYYLRAVILPVVAPVDCTWPELRESLRAMWRETTRCSNWMMTECYAGDVRRAGAVGEKMPPMPKTYLYPEARKMFPALPSQTVASIEQSVQRKYRKLRYKIVWTGDVSLPTFRYPTPFPVNAQSWDASWGEDGQRPHVSVRIGDQRRTIRLKGGSQLGRQRKNFAALVSGDAQAGEMAIYERGDDLLCKMVAWLPRPDRRSWEQTGELAVRTDAKSLLVAVNGKDDALWTYNGDHLPRWIAAHARRLHRLAEDQKYENRPVPSFRSFRDAACEKFRDRMDSACHEIAHQLVEYADRRHFASIRYDDKVKSFCPEFQWAKLRSLIIEKADASAIRVTVASGESVEETPEALANQ